jgi:DNA invertase Pin-like site-specific DNA recombinase
MAPNGYRLLQVSTQQQRKSGLGLEAQKEAVERFAAAEGFEVTHDFVEVESGVDMIGHISSLRWPRLGG